VRFVNLGLYWVAHNNEAKEVERTWRGMLWINLLFLMFVVLVPFSTALVSKHYAQPGAIRIYACNLIAVGLALEFLWVYGYKNKLMNPPVNSDFVTRGKIRNIVPPVCYLVALALSFLPGCGWSRLLICLFTPIIYVAFVAATNPKRQGERRTEPLDE
jgi:uncharacterized membrane protein